MGNGETSKVRAVVTQFLNPSMSGLDLGTGGDPLFNTSICIDKARRPGVPLHIVGDVANLKWFTPNSFDYVYSSHCLEDFVDIKPVLREWVRVIRPEGLLVLYLPDEQKYRAHCKKTGQVYNINHKDASFSSKKVVEIVNELGNMSLVKLIDPHLYYSFLVVFKKNK